MIKSFRIKNLATIEEIKMDLEKGFSILTGETGAGKSIIIDGIRVVLGEKGSPDLIRTGKKETSIEAIFHFAQNKINLKEAEKMARKGVELTSPGRDKANVLDTLAEICNLSGECGDAVDYIRMAVAEDPDNEYFREQLIRIEKILASQ